MIEEIAIRDLGVIGEASLVFSRGLTAITGETGAGKTMVLSALGLLLGNRANSAVVRVGAEQSFVEGRWFFGSSADSEGSPSGSELRADLASKVARILEEAGIAFDGAELILNRSVSPEGRSRASANGRALPVNLIAELGDELVVVHGQADQIRLKSAKAQRDALDAFGGADIAEQLRDYRTIFDQLLILRERFAALTASSSQRSARVQELREQIAVLEKLEAKDGELSRVSTQIEKYDNLDTLRQAVGGAHEALSTSGYGDEQDASALISAARKSLESVAARDLALEGLSQRMREVSIQVSDLAADLSSYLADLDGDAEVSIEWLQSRKSALVAAARLHGANGDELGAVLTTLQDELTAIDDSGDAIERLAGELQAAEQGAIDAAARLSGARKSAASALEIEVTAELAGLAMPNARLIVEIETSEQLRAHGHDEIQFMLASFSGAQARPIAKGASGGELSRIMLALEVVLSKGTQTPTFIFDEVDAGVGGEAAIEVGRRLARLAQTAQVIVVTHLAQVAAFADRQLRVLKNHAGDVTSSDVVALDGEPRIAELARMISGMADSEAARKNAQELLSLARQSV